MSVHRVTVTLPPRPIEKNALVLDVANGDGQLGTFSASQGGVSWWPRHGKQAIEMTWEQFAKLMEGS
jgi:hypothetical protein